MRRTWLGVILAALALAAGLCLIVALTPNRPPTPVSQPVSYPPSGLASNDEKRPAQPGPPPSPKPDQSPKLLGKWKHVSRIEPERARTVGIVEYRPDGTLTVEAEIRVADRKFELRGHGTWKLENDVLTTTMAESSLPDLLAPNVAKQYKILVLDENRLVYQDQSGEEWIELRMP
jgi:hypothetical protein